MTLDFLKEPPYANVGIQEEKGTYCKACSLMFRGCKTKEVVSGTQQTWMHHENIIAFKEAKEQGCRLCSWVWSRLRTSKTRTLEEIAGERAFLAFRVGRENTGEEVSLLLVFQLYTPWQETTPEGHTLVPSVPDPLHSGHARKPELIHFEGKAYIVASRVGLLLSKTCKLMINPGQLSFGAYELTRSIAYIALYDDREIQFMGTNSGSKHSREIASHWLRDCIQNHTHNDIDVKFFPDRILEIIKGDETQLKLVCKEKGSLSSVVEPYVTLSYCWGTGNHLKLTTSTMQRLVSGVKVGDLPKTFTDAVSMSTTLGMRYIWIDSLCIIQDSRTDWKEQSAVMGSIYRNSCVTIAATASSDSHDGLFRDRDSSSISSLQVHVA